MCRLLQKRLVLSTQQKRVLKSPGTLLVAWRHSAMVVQLLVSLLRLW